MQILVTGFGPFGEHTSNVSEALARSLDGAKDGAVEWHAAILPVDESAAAAVAEHAARLGCDAVVMLGLAHDRSQVCVERTARNHLDMRIPDNGGRQVREAPVEPGGAALLESTAPLDALAELVCGVRVRWSDDAGSYVCNEAYYRTLAGGARPALFVHLPPDSVIPKDVQREVVLAIGQKLAAAPSGAVRPDRTQSARRGGGRTVDTR
jgi:pyroglutamyl-peptidase